MRAHRSLRLSHVIAVGTIYGLFAAAVSYWFTLRTGRSLWTLERDPSATWTYVVLMNLVLWNSWALLIPPIVSLARRYRIERRRWRGRVALHAAGGLAFAAVHVLIVATGRFALQTAYGMTVSWWPLVEDAFLRTLDWEMAVYWAAVGFSHAIDYQAEAEDRAVRAAQLETRLVEAQLDALQRQLHPHFLFNTLHAISALVGRDPQSAERMIERLSDLLRVTLSTRARQEVPLADELEYTSRYLEIQSVHFGSRLAVGVDVEPGVRQALVPFLLLQPLVENAIQHGIAPRASGGCLEITARRDGDELVIGVADDGVGIGRDRMAADDRGIGVSNTRARLERLYGDRQRLALVSPPGGGCAVEVRLPFKLWGATDRVEVSA